MARKSEEDSQSIPFLATDPSDFAGLENKLVVQRRYWKLERQGLYKDRKQERKNSK